MAKPFKELQSRFSEEFVRGLLESEGEDFIDNLTPAQEKLLQQEMNRYVSEQVKRYTNEPTKSEFESMDPGEKARILSGQTGVPFDEAYQRVAGAPRTVGSDLYQSSFGEKIADRLADWGSGLGRTGSALLSGGDPLEEMATTQGQGFVKTLAKDPILPYSLGIGGLVGNTGRVLADPFFRGSAIGGASSLLGAGQEGRLPSMGELGTDVLFGIGGETAGSLLGRGLSGAMKETGSFAGQGKAIGEALEYTKPRLQNPITKQGLRSPIDLSKRQQVAKYTGLENEIGQELADKVINFEQFLPEAPQVKQMLNSMPDIDGFEMVKALETAKIKGALTPESAAANEAIDKRINFLLEQVDPQTGKLSAKDAYELRKQFDEKVDFGQVEGGSSISDKVEKAYQKGRTKIREQLIESARSTGNEQYEKLMESLANKLQVRSELLRKLGKSESVIRDRAQGFVSNLQGMNKEELRKTVEQLKNITGEDISEKSLLAMYGRALGIEEGGVLPWTSDITTGKALLGFTPVGSPKIQGNVIYPAADALKTTLTTPGLSTIISERLIGDRKNELIPILSGYEDQGGY